MSILIHEVKTIRLYGVLGERFGRVHSMAVSSPIEALKALSVMIPGFQQFMLESKGRGLTFAVFEGKRNLRKDDLQLQANGNDIRIAPLIMGSKKAGMFQTILGAVLVVAGAVLSFTPFAAASPYLYMTGASMMLGGVVQMLSPMQG
ncbi:tail assembly protein, partial [Serratia marcescens]